MEATRPKPSNRMHQPRPLLTESLVYHVCSIPHDPRITVAELRRPEWDLDYEYFASVSAFDVATAWTKADAFASHNNCRGITVGDVIVTPDGNVNRRHLNGWTVIDELSGKYLPPECRCCEHCRCIRHQPELVNVSADDVFLVCEECREGIVFG